MSKKAIFTVNIGNYDWPPIPPAGNYDWDKILFTDDDREQSFGWDRVIVVGGNKERPDLESRKYKWLSHIFLDKYDLVCYFDGNIQILRDLPNKPFRVVHPKRRNVVQEALACAEYKHRWTEESINKQIRHFKEEGFPDNLGLFLNGFFIREHSKKENELCEEVWKILNEYTSRDQIALPYAMWKLNYTHSPGQLVSASTVGRYIKSGFHKNRKPKLYGGDLEINVHHITPSRSDRNLGRAINEIVEGLPEQDWVCVRDMDTLVLDTESYTRQCEQIARSGEFQLVSCMTNRLGLEWQLVGGKISDEADINYHINLAKELGSGDPIVEEFDREVAGLMHLYPKSVWSEVGGYPEGFIVYEDELLDYKFYKMLKERGIKVGICRSIYLLHLYRWGFDPRSFEGKKHLYLENRMYGK